ncbi:alcohol dehydrogenase catalytic domain-containing protein [Mycolicibacterium novocastrense]|uniref:Alcohol dehydrogenase GroES domain-containing protein n=1 Tax=Mycolicibacterium novocastrense TaxID=59813 RepID=A0AAW5SV53_MYCNV|nr:alcohol dehydrogenase catalytic domain-containing protein [Mycolicibacterium novocastrense]MCV7026947.1 alcohol dehydrogenase catalytic domain-containing protein [Mycolicibacterium novocastrense]UUO02187.1 alcohol dehydrogenase catalytic domain-containing protein [Mycolicibacterium novocastrense]GAT08649.1 alcohol dehydrogenase GroES domain-containing protein [Mycolicibacterium novocastrense]
MRIRGAVLEEIGRPRPYAASKPLTVGELDLAAPGPGELLVRVEAAGLCHSDLSVVDGNRVRPVPMLLGHEAAGVVEEIGAGGSDVATGTRVVMTFLPRCGECRACATDGLTPCEPGSAANGAGTLMTGQRRLSRDGEPVHHHLGVSGFATHAVVDRRSVVPVPDDVPAVVASLLGCAVLTGGGAVINAGRPRPGDTVAIVGLGGVGMAAALTALAAEDVRVVGIDQLPDKLERARRLGVHDAYTPQEARDSGFKAAVVIEAVGHPSALETAVELTAPGGRTVTVGLPRPDARVSLSPLGFVAEGRSLIGSYLGSAVPAREIPHFVELWRARRLPVESLVSSTIALDEINSGMDELADGRAVRQVIRFD